MIIIQKYNNNSHSPFRGLSWDFKGCRPAQLKDIARVDSVLIRIQMKNRSVYRID